ncbi:S8 family serine peptidase [Spongiimicrobium salis]|uniref:S8 family serine peptidase n=1 Tax=Spongiimicrobium salis TaxID=1667022 RepID=UPI00374D3781
MDYKMPFPKVWTNLAYSLIFLTSFFAKAQSTFQAEKISAAYQNTELRSFTQLLEDEFETYATTVNDLAQKNGWKLEEQLPNGSFTELQGIGSDGSPIYYQTFNDDVRLVSRANTLYSGGLLDLGIDGEGMKIGVWDAGVARISHQEFDKRARIGDNTTKIDPHATLVSGVLVASGVNKKSQGVAYKAEMTTSNWTRDKIEVAQAAENGLLLSNHSYGIHPGRVPDWYFGSYIKVSQDWDNIMFNAPYYLMVTSAGNAQRLMHNEVPVYGSAADGFDLILGFAAAKNGITVAAADTEINKEGVLIQGNVARYSSFGPVDDGRIKPDIAGTGSNIFSTTAVHDKSYATSTGTSMATPGVTGAMLLLQQYYERLHNTYMKAATLKGLVLHSADDVNEVGPDYKMGWGVMNAKNAAEIISREAYSTLLIEESLKEGEMYTITVEANEIEPLLASVSWTDPAGEYINRGIENDITPALINDLDIRIRQGDQVFYPWRLNPARAANPATRGDNSVDPFENIKIDKGNGTYTIEITHKGNLSGKKQDFSLIVSGLALVSCKTTVPTGLEKTASTAKTLSLEWEPVAEASFELAYKEKENTEWYMVYTNENTAILEGLKPGATYEYKIKTSCTANVASAYTAIQTFTFLGEDTILDNSEDYTVLESTKEVTFSVFPNPAVDHILLQGDLSSDARYSIITTTGLIVKSGSVRNKTIAVDQLSSGLYILNIQDYHGSSSKKFYKK